MPAADDKEHRGQRGREAEGKAGQSDRSVKVMLAPVDKRLRSIADIATSFGAIDCTRRADTNNTQANNQIVKLRIIEAESVFWENV